MTAPAHPFGVDLDSADEVYRYTQTQRLVVAEAVLPSGITAADLKQLDPKLLNIALKSIDGMDKQVLARQRMETDKEIAQDDKETARLITSAMAEMVGNPFEKTNAPTDNEGAMPTPDLPEPEVVPGELDVGLVELSAKDFRAEAERIAEEQANAPEEDEDDNKGYGF